MRAFTRSKSASVLAYFHIKDKIEDKSEENNIICILHGTNASLVNSLFNAEINTSYNLIFTSLHTRRNLSHFSRIHKQDRDLTLYVLNGIVRRMMELIPFAVKLH